MLKTILINTMLLLVSLLLSLVAAIYLYVRWAAWMGASHQYPLVKDIGHNSFAQKIFLDINADQLFKRVAEQEESAGTLQTTWDYNTGIALSKTLYQPTEMYGEAKYRYLPNITVFNGRIWDGFGYRSLATRVTPEIRNLIVQSHPAYETFFTTNEYGFKPTDFTLAPGALPVFFLGDSFTEGLWIAPHDTFVNRFAMLFRDQGVPMVSFNLGVNGYSPLEESWMLEHFGEQLKPQLVVVNLFPNDVATSTWAVITDSQVPEQNYQDMLRSMDRLRDYTRAHHMQLVVSVIPPLWRPEPSQFSPRFWDRVAQWCRQNRIRYLDARDVLYTDNINQYYIDFDPHLSVEGHRVYAQFLYDHLKADVTSIYKPLTKH